jgi:tetratricopeptide (TPR) repeat protein
MQKLLPSNHPSCATIYNNIGEIHRATEQYLPALAFYEKTLDIQLKSLSPDHLDIAQTYSRIVLVHKSLEDYSVAFSY